MSTIAVTPEAGGRVGLLGTVVAGNLVGGSVIVLLAWRIDRHRNLRTA